MEYSHGIEAGIKRYLWVHRNIGLFRVLIVRDITRVFSLYMVSRRRFRNDIFIND